jgi:prophage regulatory protein
MVNRLLKASEILELVPFSIQHIYRLMHRGEFPLAVKVGAWRVAWKESEVLEWIESRPRAPYEKKSDTRD